MSAHLPEPDEIAGHYNTLLRGLNGEYIHQRWGDSPIKRRHHRQTELALTHALAAVPSLGDVVEIGCGPAVWTPLFLEGAKSVSLLDISEEMLKEARVRIEALDSGRHAGKVSYACGDFLEHPVSAASCDTIVSSRAFEYMADKQGFVDKCFNMLRPGGTLIVITKNCDWYDSRKSIRELAQQSHEDLDVGRTMQLDLSGWKQVAAMYDRAGFRPARAYPVILGTYEVNLLANRPALAIVDAIHRAIYRHPIGLAGRMMTPLMESFLVMASKAT